MWILELSRTCITPGTWVLLLLIMVGCGPDSEKAGHGLDDAAHVVRIQVDADTGYRLSGQIPLADAGSKVEAIVELVYLNHEGIPLAGSLINRHLKLHGLLDVNEFQRLIKSPPDSEFLLLVFRELTGPREEWVGLSSEWKLEITENRNSLMDGFIEAATRSGQHDVRHAGTGAQGDFRINGHKRHLVPLDNKPLMVKIDVTSLAICQLVGRAFSKRTTADDLAMVQLVFLDENGSPVENILSTESGDSISRDGIFFDIPISPDGKLFSSSVRIPDDAAVMVLGFRTLNRVVDETPLISNEWLLMSSGISEYSMKKLRSIFDHHPELTYRWDEIKSDGSFQILDGDRDRVELGEVPFVVRLPVDPDTTYDLSGYAHPISTPAHDRALLQVLFMDRFGNLIPGPYRYTRWSSTLSSDFHYISFEREGKDFSQLIKTPPDARNVLLGFRDWRLFVVERPHVLNRWKLVKKPDGTVTVGKSSRNDNAAPPKYQPDAISTNAVKKLLSEKFNLQEEKDVHWNVTGSKGKFNISLEDGKFLELEDAAKVMHIKVEGGKTYLLDGRGFSDAKEAGHHAILQWVFLDQQRKLFEASEGSGPYDETLNTYSMLIPTSRKGEESFHFIRTPGNAAGILLGFRSWRAPEGKTSRVSNQWSLKTWNLEKSFNNSDMAGVHSIPIKRKVEFLLTGGDEKHVSLEYSARVVRVEVEGGAIYDLSGSAISRETTSETLALMQVVFLDNQSVPLMNSGENISFSRSLGTYYYYLPVSPGGERFWHPVKMPEDTESLLLGFRLWKDTEGDSLRVTNKWMLVKN